MCSLKWNLSFRVAEVWVLYRWGCHSGWFVAAGPWKSGRLACPIITIVINTKKNHSLKEQERWGFCFLFFCGQAPTRLSYKPSAVKCMFKNSINSAFSLELRKLRGDKQLEKSLSVTFNTMQSHFFTSLKVKPFSYVKTPLYRYFFTHKSRLFPLKRRWLVRSYSDQLEAIQADLNSQLHCKNPDNAKEAVREQNAARMTSASLHALAQLYCGPRCCREPLHPPPPLYGACLLCHFMLSRGALSLRSDALQRAALRWCSIFPVRLWAPPSSHRPPNPTNQPASACCSVKGGFTNIFSRAMLLEYTRLCGGKKKCLKQLKLQGLKYIFLSFFTKLPQFTHRRQGFLLWFWWNIAKFPCERELICSGKGVEKVFVRGSAVWHLFLKMRWLLERCHCGAPSRDTHLEKHQHQTHFSRRHITLPTVPVTSACSPGLPSRPVLFFLI